MTVSRSFNIGIAGLNAYGTGMGVISDNIANSGTFGFKAGRAEFQDTLATTLNGIEGGDQLGTGVRLGKVKLIMGQGDISRTEKITDLAINGDGFFRVQTPTGHAYTRDGSMNFNKHGNLVTGHGHEVFGFAVGENGDVTSTIEPIKIKRHTIPAQQTTEANIDMNFDSRSRVVNFDVNNPEDTSNFYHTLTVYDSNGTARLINMYYNKDNANNWSYRAVVDQRIIDPTADKKLTVMAEGALIFNEKGQLLEEKVKSSAFNFGPGAKPNQNIKFNFGKSIKEGGKGLEAATQYGSITAVARHTVDGHTAAPIASFSFDVDGILNAVYQNGETRGIAQVAVAKFENNEGLYKMGKNLYRDTDISGNAIMGRPSQGGRGEIVAQSLELSNVDIADQFVQLITAQRNFQANAKTLQTADKMLQEVMDLKR